MASLIKKLINSEYAARPVGPYNHAVIADRTVYVSGCLGLDEKTKQLVPGGVKEQTEKALHNMAAILIAANSSIDKVVKTTIFVKNISEFSIVNEVYKSVFNKEFPARSTLQVAKLPMDALVEIECIALTGNVVVLHGE